MPLPRCLRRDTPEHARSNMRIPRPRLPQATSFCAPGVGGVEMVLDLGVALLELEVWVVSSSDCLSVFRSFVRSFVPRRPTDFSYLQPAQLNST